MAKSTVQNKHIPDERIGNRADVANWFGVAPTTVDQWLRRGCPYLQRGGRGKQWQFDFLAVAKWKYGAPDDVEGDPEKLPAKERLDWFRSERERLKHLQECGELMLAVEYENSLAGAFKVLAVTLESLPDVLERDANIGGEAVERCQDVIDRVREELYRRLSCGDAD